MDYSKENQNAEREQMPQTGSDESGDASGVKRKTSF